MWTVVYIAPNEPMAELIRRRLQSQGLLVKLRQGSKDGLASGSEGHFEVLVPESEVEDAHELVSEALRSY